jgi:23S rRNA (guanosine2251-2'-O)-methyltransferase
MTIYGKNPAMEVLKSKKRVTKAYVTKTTLELIKPYSKQIGEVQVIDAVKMSKQFGDKTQGIVLEIAEYKYADLNKVLKRVEEKENVTLVILDSLEDPHNLGAILRSADATGVDGIIIPKNRSVRLNDTVAKVSTGAIEHVDVCEVTNLNMTINDLKDKGFWVIGLELDGTIDYREQDYKGKIAVVVGSEGRGISKLVKENCDFLVRIPMYGKVNSLNASVACALFLAQIYPIHEFTRPR